MTAVHQFVPNLAPRDAVGGHVLEVRRTLRDAGYASEIYVGNVVPELRGETRQYEAYDGGVQAGTWLLYQASTGHPMAEFVGDRPEPKLVDYHNVTPPSYFAGWEPRVAAELSAGLRQVEALAPRTTLGLADSAFNAADLEAMGYARTVVVPILLDVARLDVEPDADELARLQAERARGGADWLFVGRLAPNKAQHDLVKAFAAYRRAYDPRARLHLIGFPSSHAYLVTLRRFVAALGLGEAVSMPGSLAPAALAARWRVADVFVSLSEHEGFLVPLLEAWHHRVPVVAYAAAAVPETLGAGGVLLHDKAPAIVAAAVSCVLADEAARAALLRAGELRLEEFSLPRSQERLLAAVGDATGGP